MSLAQPPTLSVSLMGPLSVSRGPATWTGSRLGSRKARQLLGLLAVERARATSVERIADALWPLQPPTAPADNVATLVSRLRKALGPEIVVGGREGYRLGAGVTVDLELAEGWAAEAEARLRADEPGLALASGRRAEMLLTRGDVLADDPDSEWLRPARQEQVALLARTRHALSAAALALGDLAGAEAHAARAVAADPYDEHALRLAMQAWITAGAPAKALSLYASLQRRLADDLGTDPAPETQQIYLQALRFEPPPVRTPTPMPVETTGLVGRADELRELRRAWQQAAAGYPRLVLVVGEAGIGKSSLCDELAQIARGTGGRVLRARCFEAERSLFVQPVVDAVAELVRRTAPDEVKAFTTRHTAVLADLVPEVAAVWGSVPPRRRGSAEIERRIAFEAVAAVVTDAAAAEPLLVYLDDLHCAGRSTVEFLHYLTRRLADRPVLLLGAVRAEEGAEVLAALADVSDRVELGPLPAAAVHALAAAAGAAEHAADISRRTGGHALYVVETLRALAAGTAAIPASLETAVLARVRRGGHAIEDVLRTAAVLGNSFDPVDLATVRGDHSGTTLALCGGALEARLLTAAGRHYEFAHDLVREVLYRTTPEPTRRAVHLRAADALTRRPEAVAHHAAAAGDLERAARAWLAAGDQALCNGAAVDAVSLLTASIDAAGEVRLGEVQARAHLARCRAHAAATDYPAAFVDAQVAVAVAQDVGDRHLEVAALRELGGEVPTAMGRSVADCMVPLQRALVLATSLGDRRMQADVEAWMAVLASNGLQFAASIEHGVRAVAAARSSGDPEALAAALDGRKTPLAYLGEVAALTPVLDELEPLLRQQGDWFRLHWAVFESSFVPLARGDWSSARSRIEQALEVQRRSGYTAYAGWHVAHLGWIARFTGRHDEALRLGERALALSNDATHAWCLVQAASVLGSTLLAAGRRDDAVSVLQRAESAARIDGGESYLLRCLAPLAEATRSRDLLTEADALLAGIVAPAGAAFILGDECYLAVARAWLEHGEPDRARDVLEPLLVAAGRTGWVAPLAQAAVTAAAAETRLGRLTDAARHARVAARLATAHGLPTVAAAAVGVLA